MSVFYSEEKDEKIIWTFDEACQKVIKVAKTKDDISPEVKPLFKWFGLEKLRDAKRLIIPRIIDASMDFIPCVEIDKENK